MYSDYDEQVSEDSILLHKSVFRGLYAFKKILTPVTKRNSSG